MKRHWTSLIASGTAVLLVAAGGFINLGASPALAAGSIDFSPAIVSSNDSTVVASSPVVADGVATSTITVTVEDTTDTPVSGDLVALTKSGGTSVVTAVNATTNGSGVAIFTATDLNVESGITYIATDTPGPLNKVSNVVNFVARTADSTQSTVTASTPVLADGVATSAVTVTVHDGNNVAVVGDPITLVSSGTTTTITAVSATTNSSGVATFTVTDSTPETGVTFTATDAPGPLDKVSNAVAFTTPTASNTTSTVSASSPVLADGVATSTITVTVLDSSSVAISADTVTLAHTGAAVITGAGVTNSSGVATFTATDLTAQSVTFTATDAPGTLNKASGAVSFATPTADNDTSSISATSPVVADGVATSAVTVTVLDATSVPISGDPVTLAVGGSADSTVVDGTTNSDGVATFTVTDTVAESVSVTASDPSGTVTLDKTTTLPVNFTAPVSDNTLSNISAGPPEVAANGVRQATVSVFVGDDTPAPVSGDVVTLHTSSTHAVITAVNATTNVDGDATFTVTDATVESDITFTATDGNGLSLAPSSPVNFIPAADNSLSTMAVSSPVVADGVASSTVTMRVKDSRGVAISGDPVVLIPSNGSHVAITGSGLTNSSGITTFHITDTTVENVTFTAEDFPIFFNIIFAGTLDKVSSSVAFTAPAASDGASTITATSPVVADGVASSVVDVQVNDSTPAPLVGDAVTLTSSDPTHTVITASPTSTDADGNVEFTVTGSVVESGVTFTAADTHGLSLTSSPVDFIPAADNALSTISATTPVIADGVASSLITVTVKDSNGVTINDDLVSLTTSGGTSVVSAPVTTNINGVATFTATDLSAETGVFFTATDDSGDLNITTSTGVAFTTPVADNDSSIIAATSPVIADGVATSAVTVTVLDANLVPISGDPVSLASTGSAIVSAPVATNVSGVATFTVTDTTAESVTFTATDAPGPLSIVEEGVHFTTPVADDNVSSITATSPVIGNGVATSALTVTVLDTNSVPLAGDLVTLTPTGSALVSASATTNGAGVATFTATDSTVESVAFTATDGIDGDLFLNSDPVDFAAVTINPATPTAGSTTTTGSAAFTSQLAVTGSTGTVSYTKTGGSAHLTVGATGRVATTGTMPAGTYAVSGTTADTHGDAGVFALTLTVTAVTIRQAPSTSGTALTTGSAAYTHQLTVTGNNGLVTYAKTAGNAHLTVGARGMVTTTGRLTAGVYAASGRTTDVNGDHGTFSFSLKVSQPPLTGPTVSIANHGAATIIGLDAAAKAGTKVTVKVFTGGKLVTTATTTVGTVHRITYTTKALTTGKYRVEFVVAGNVVKTTIVTVG